MGAIIEKKEDGMKEAVPVDDWKMSVEEFNKNGCLINGD